MSRATVDPLGRVHRMNGLRAGEEAIMWEGVHAVSIRRQSSRLREAGQNDAQAISESHYRNFRPKAAQAGEVPAHDEKSSFLSCCNRDVSQGKPGANATRARTKLPAPLTLSYWYGNALALTIYVNANELHSLLLRAAVCAMPA